MGGGGLVLLEISAKDPYISGTRAAPQRNRSIFPMFKRFVMAGNWSPDSWQSKPIRQIPVYPDAKVKGLSNDCQVPPLVFAGEARDLKRKFADVAEGLSTSRGRLRREFRRIPPR